MRLLVISILAVFIVAGVVLGALNADLVTYDFAFTQVHLPKGAALLGALVLGWLLGGLAAWAGLQSSQRRRQRCDAGKPLPPAS